MTENRTASLCRASAGIENAIQDLELADACAIVTAHLHVIFDQLPPRMVDILLILLVTHAWESRDACAQGRPPNYSTEYQLMHWADVLRYGTDVHVSVSPSIIMT